MDLPDGDAELTEFTAMDVQSVKGVGHGASGFPFLIMKGLPGQVAKGQRDCPKCSKNHDADFSGDNCENCGTKLPDGDAAKASGEASVNCPTCKGDGKIMAGERDCPDCDASGKVSPDKAKTLAAKSIARAIIAAPLELAKAIGADGQVDEAPDVDLANQILAMLGRAMQAEAAEMAAGNAGEAGDIMELAAAAQAVRCWRDGEQAVSMGDVMPASMLAQSARLDIPETATPEQVAAVKALLEESREGASKGQIAKEGTDVDTVVQGAGDLDEVVKAAIAKATAPLEKLRTELEATLAKVRATPVPGGLVLSHNVQLKQAGAVVNDDMAAKAALYRAKAKDATAPGDREGYLALARETEEEARKG